MSGFGHLWRRLFRQGARRETRPLIAPAASRQERRQANEVYTPTQPRTAQSAFTGRQREIDTVVQALTEDRAHVVLYSERGRGKTSLANVVVERLRRSGLIVVRTQCDAASTFDSFMRELVSDLPGTFLRGAPAGEDDAGCESILPNAPVRPHDVVAILPKLRVRSLICVIDEFDRVHDAHSRTMLADTIKQVSDRGLPLLFMIIGVSDSLEQLIGQHPSIQRNVVAVPLPLMSDESVVAVLETGARDAQLTFPPALAAKIAAMSRGLPYAAHLLALRVAQAAAQRGTRNIEERDFTAAVDRLLLETPLAIVQQYDELTAGGTDAAMVAGLDAIARCRQDAWGHIPFSEGGGGGEGVVVGAARVDDACWLRLRDAGVLRPYPGNPGHLAHANRALILYVLLRGSDKPTVAGAAVRPGPVGREAVGTTSDLGSP